MLIFMRIVAFLMGVLILGCTAVVVFFAGMSVIDMVPGYSGGDPHPSLMLSLASVGVAMCFGYFVFAFFANKLIKLNELVQSLAVLSLAPSLIGSFIWMMVAYKTMFVLIPLLWFAITLVLVAMLFRNKPENDKLQSKAS